MLKLSRRGFLSLIGSASLLSLIGCNSKYAEEEKKTMISYMFLQNCELLTCIDETMLVSYQPAAQKFVVTKLDIINDSFEELDIYQSDIIEQNGNLEQFYNEFNVVDATPATDVFIKQFGSKNYYTLDEVSEIIKPKNYQKTK